MTVENTSQENILNKLGIESLNNMQSKAHETILSEKEVLLFSPTGTGKTLAFLLPIIQLLDPQSDDIQVLILVPSRELAIQIEQVIRSMGSGYKTNAVYGGKPGAKDKVELRHAPAILIGTPGRVADHIRRETINTKTITTLVLDEFDKSLEVGFETEMKEIINALPALDKKILTSATKRIAIPGFMKMKKPVELNFSKDEESKLQLKAVIARDDKLNTLKELITHTGSERGIIFCNVKETLHAVSDFFDQNSIPHACFYGGLEQVDRERALIQFRNGTHRLLLSTDLAARGIDVPEIDFIIHYEIPPRQAEFTHRNGRTARMHKHGVAYVLKLYNEKLPGFVNTQGVEELQPETSVYQPQWETVYISGGRKDKISKGDIAGLFMKQGGMEKEQLGVIELQQDCAYVAVDASVALDVVKRLNNSKLKKKKVRISLIQ